MTALGELAGLPRWIAWRSETRNGKSTKVPYAPQRGKAKADDPATWGTRAEAEARAAKIVKGSGGGVGIQLGLIGDMVLAGVDLDACLGPDGTITPWANNILNAMPTYAEKSPSGRGIKVFFNIGSAAVRPFLERIGIKDGQWGCRRGIPGKDDRDHGPAVEVYTDKRYFAVTGDRWPDSPDHLACLDDAQLDRLAQLIPKPTFPKSPKGKRKGGGSDSSRSARAMRIGHLMHAAGKTFDEFCDAVRTDPETAGWCIEKGILDCFRELHRVWNKVRAEGHGIDMVRVSDIEAQPVRWRWPGMIAVGKLTILAGDPGLGKSQLALAIAAIVTSGGLFPVSGSQAEPGSVVILSAEDDPADTIRPRLEAAGANLERCHILKAVRRKFGEKQASRGFSIDQDLPRLEKALANIEGVRLVVIDPISAYLGSTDSHNNTQVRGVLAPLSELAARCGVAVLAVSHLSKAREAEAISRVSGSMAFVAAARAAFIVIRDPDNGEQRFFVPLKNNLGEDRTSYAYQVEPVTLPNDIETSRIAWSPEPVTKTVDELLSPRIDRKAPSKLEDASLWLRRMLAGGPIPQPELETKVKGSGHSWATVRRAAQDLKIVKEKGGFKGGWVWSLPPTKVPE